MRETVCPDCDDYATEVIRSPLLNQRTIDCRNCGRITRQLVDRKTQDRAQRARRRDQQKYDRWRERVCDRPRTRLHRPLQATPEMRAAWRSVRKAKRSDALIRRGQRFLKLTLDACRDEDSDPDAWREIWKLDSDGLHSHRSRGGPAGYPTVSNANLGYGTLGMYRRQVFRSEPHYDVRVDVKRHGGDLDKMRATLLHEVLHAVDSEAGISDEGHDRLWRKRLARFERMFPPSQFGTRA